MTKAFVLINCELGSEEQIISELKTFSDITQVRGTFGAYDIIAEVSSESIEKVLFNSGIKISARWSRHAFKPSKTDWVAKFNSSNKIQYPDFIAAKRGPSCHSKHIELFPSEGKSLPIKSLISVCSDKLIRTNVFPVNEANAVKVNYFKKRFF